MYSWDLTKLVSLVNFLIGSHSPPSGRLFGPSSTSSVASIGRTRDVQCHQCKGFGHVLRDYPNKRVLVVKNDGGYSSASDYDEQTLALLAADDAGSEEPPDEQLVRRMRSIMRASLCSVCLVHKWRRRSKISGIHCSKPNV